MVGVSEMLTIIAVLIFILFIIIYGYFFVYRRLQKDLETYKESFEEASKFASAAPPPADGPDGLPGLNAYELYLIDLIDNAPGPPVYDDFATFFSSYVGINPVTDYQTYLIGILTTNAIPFLNFMDFLDMYNGNDGAAGNDAPPAVDGSRGEDGSIGNVGPAGIDGGVGPNGNKGATGEIGDTFVSFIPNNELIEESVRPGVLDNAAIFNPAFFPGNAASATSPENYPSCEFIKYNSEVSVDDRNPTSSNTQADIRYYYKGFHLFDLTATWTNDPSGPTMYASYLIYTVDPFQIIGITSPLTINECDTSVDLETSINNVSSQDLKFRVIFSKNKGLTESVFTFNVVEENLQEKSFLLERVVPTDPFIKQLYDTVELTPGLNDNFDLEQKCKISPIKQVNSGGTDNFIININ